ncbi:hypothetical protein KIL84_011076 [Mauremys mutica]|uniref:Uncharacterized protein n=1 Tax=Mauremys mutica TaxID=74926 RepID=A0A9D4B1M3_9SAUR|nr:hypothetical protein KIL84_011076 [Mauremys mutica]
MRRARNTAGITFPKDFLHVDPSLQTRSWRLGERGREENVSKQIFWDLLKVLETSYFFHNPFAHPEPFPHAVSFDKKPFSGIFPHSQILQMHTTQSTSSSI